MLWNAWRRSRRATPWRRDPEEMLAVFHRVFQPWQYNPLSKGHCEADVRPKKVPVLRTSIQFELGDESQLGQHNMAHAQEALEFVEGVEEQAVTVPKRACGS